MNMTNAREGSASALLKAERSKPENGHLQLDPPPTIKGAGVPRWLRIWFWVCIVIAVAAAARRFIALVRPLGTGSLMSGFDSTFAYRNTLTFAHIIPATAFVVLVPFVLFRAPRKRWPERALLLLGVIVGITAYAISVDAVGGWTERTAVLFFNSLFLFSIGRAFMYDKPERLFRCDGG